LCSEKTNLDFDDLEKDLNDWMGNYKTKRPHQGRPCQGITPVATFWENTHLAKAKILDMRENKPPLAA
jgi:hypothetical protein